MKLQSFLEKYVQSTRSLVFLFLSSHLVLWTMMRYTFPKINAQFGTNAFDIRPFGYSLAEARSMLGNLSEQITDLYLFPQLCLLDVLYPAMLALFLSGFIYRLLKKTDSKIYTVLLIIPFIAMLLDYSENICIIRMITNPADVSDTVIHLSNVFTISKGLCTSFAWLCIVIYSIKWLLLKLRA